MLQTPLDSDVDRPTDDGPGPGLVVVFSGDGPTLLAHRVDAKGLVIGRDLLADHRISRAHARVRLVEDGFVVVDLGSRNGTRVGGHQIAEEVRVEAPAVIRIGRTVCALVADVRRLEGARVEIVGDTVVGPSTALARMQIDRAARSGGTLLVTGESGTGKELAARAFHEAAGVRGPLVAVNCAAIPAGLAERLLFGAQRGAFSGADRDVEGYLGSADGGTLFLDEIAELEAPVQAKLLRVLESRELLPLGASRPRRIELRIVVATLRSLRDEVAAGRFREDLYYRIGLPEVRLPPLRDRPEEIPWLIAQAVERAAPGLGVHPSLIEHCLLRPWPGNVRELLAEIRRAATLAHEGGRAEVRGEDLAAAAGTILERPAETTPTPTPAPRRRGEMPPPGAIERALETAVGNVTRAARALGVHRNQLRRYLAQRKPGS